MEPHIFCGPEFVLEVPNALVGQLLCPPEGNATEHADNNNNNDNTVDGSTTMATDWSFQTDYAQSIQRELFALCSPSLRRRLAHAARSPISTNTKALVYSAEPLRSSGPVPPEPPSAAPQYAQRIRGRKSLTPEEETFLVQSIKVTASSSSSSSADCVYFLVSISDSRMAAEVYMLCLRNVCIALPQRVRMFNYYRQRARATGIDPSSIMQKRDTLRAHCNLEDTLWEALDEALTPDVLEGVMAKVAQTGSGGRLLTSSELHQQRVEALLRYCEDHVQHAGVLTNDEAASPFLIAMGLFLKLELTAEDLFKSFVRHPRRVVRAVALFISRHMLPPEELPPFYYPSLHDDIVIACSADMDVTCAMRELSRQLLLKEDVNEAWLPQYHPYWKEHVVLPGIAAMERHWAAQEAARQSRRAAMGPPGAEGDAAAAADEESDFLVGGDGVGGGAVKGSGRGVSSLGFHSIKDLMNYAKQQERTLVPQSMATLVARTQRRRAREDDEDQAIDDGGSMSGSDADAWEEGSDTDDFLIDVAVEGDNEGLRRGGRRVEGGNDNATASSSSNVAGRMHTAAARVEAALQKRSNAAGGDAIDAHALVRKIGQRVMLSLLGRTKPFDRHDPTYLEF